MSLATKHIAILVDNYFEQSEFEEPLRFLKEKGAEVTVISSSTRDIQAMEHVLLSDIFTADSMLDEINPSDFDGLVLPGGVINADQLRTFKKAQDWVNQFFDENKLIAAICHAPWLAVSADIVEGRKLTSWPSLQDDIRNAGGEWTDLPVVVDGNLITSRNPDDIPDFNKAIAEWFNS